MKISINCDMGESFSLYKMGDDEAMMPLISAANIACGFHASDPNHMSKTVELAKRNGVSVGAHPSLPDLQGFGRREMKIPVEELTNIVVYQVGALKAFLTAAGMPLNHIKPHGALYGMASRDEAVANAICDAAQVFDVPVMGLSGTVHEEVYTARGIEFIAEYFADLDYDDSGKLIITQEHTAVDPEVAAERVRRAVEQGETESKGGRTLKVKADTICVHSDTPGAVDVASAVFNAVRTHLA